MRFYDIRITSPDGKSVLPASLGGNSLTSLVNGQTNPAALDIEFDLPVVVGASPDSNAWLKIKGIGLAQIGNAFNLNGMNISIFGGMAKGLPLANPAQQGLLVKGQILQAFGNWVGIEQTLEMNITAGAGASTTPSPLIGSPTAPGNFVLNWPSGTQLSAAIAQMLTTAMPNIQQKISISQKLVQNHDEPHVAQSLYQMADFLNTRSQAIIGGNYPGITIAFNGQTVVVTDGTTTNTTTGAATSSTATPATSVKKIAFQDLIGQPTWIAPQTITCKFVLRGDLSVGDTITLPPSLYTTQAAAFPAFNNPSNNLSFTGNFMIQQLHHYGAFRQPDAGAWNSTIYATPQGVGS